jgi:uncharacterized membrane protein
MEGAQIHMLVNHFPILGVFFGAFILLGGVFFKKLDIVKTGLFVLIFSGIMALPAYFSGEEAEEVVEEMGISHDIIHEHEEQAETVIWLVEILALLSIGGLIILQKSTERYRLIGLSLASLALVTFAFLAQVGHSGGLINHPELRENKQVENTIDED